MSMKSKSGVVSLVLASVVGLAAIGAVSGCEKKEAPQPKLPAQPPTNK